MISRFTAATLQGMGSYRITTNDLLTYLFSSSKCLQNVYFMGHLPEPFGGDPGAPASPNDFKC